MGEALIALAALTVGLTAGAFVVIVALLGVRGVMGRVGDRRG